MEPLPDNPPSNRQPDACRLSVIVPTYREAANVAELSGRLFKALDQSPELAGAGAAELIFVDDDSQDGIEQEVARGPHAARTRVLVRKGERGLASAVLHGLRSARGRYVVVMDADLSHPPEMVPELVRPLGDGQADMVIGSRYAPGGSTDDEWGFFRRLNSRFATLLARPFARVSDPMSGFFAFQRRLLDGAGFLNPVGYKIGLELLVKCRCRAARVVELPIHFADRRRGRSKLTLGQQLHYIEHLSRLYDFKYPRLVPVAKFLIVACLGLLAGYGWAWLGAWIDEWWAYLGSDWLLTAYWPAIAINGLAYWRYIKQMKGQVPIRRPVFDFVVISTFEWMTYLTTTYSALIVLRIVPMYGPPLGQCWWWFPFMGAYCTRFVLRKLAGHDIRGLPAPRIDD